MEHCGERIMNLNKVNKMARDQLIKEKGHTIKQTEKKPPFGTIRNLQSRVFVVKTIVWVNDI